MNPPTNEQINVLANKLYLESVHSPGAHHDVAKELLTLRAQLDTAKLSSEKAAIGFRKVIELQKQQLDTAKKALERIVSISPFAMPHDNPKSIANQLSSIAQQAISQINKK